MEFFYEVAVLASKLVRLEGLIEYIIVDGSNKINVRAICDRVNYRIYFNKQWIESADVNELIECILHESRHCYQQACIDFPEIFNKELKQIVELWKHDFDNPIAPEIDFNSYYNLASEKDARDFSSRIMLVIKENAIS